MSTKKSINWSKIIGTTWNAVGDKTVKSVLSLAMKRLTNSLQEKFEVKQEQTEEVTTTLSSCISYMITQKVNERTIDVNYVSKMLQSNLIPTIASIASNNPKGDEIIQTISSYVSEFADNETLVTILDQFAGKEIIEQLQFTAKQIASLKLQDTNAETKEGIVAIEEEVETGLVKETVAEEVQIVEGNDLPQVKKKMTNEEDEQFIEQVFDATKLDFSSPQAVAASFEKFITVAGEVAKFTELQKTKRTQIRANANVAIKKVEAMRDVLQEYLEKSFDERTAVFAKQFEVVDQALINGDNVMLSTGLTAINQLAASSPFKALADLNTVQQMLTTDEVEEFDI